MARFWTPEQYEAHQKRVNAWRKPAPELVGNCELVTINVAEGGTAIKPVLGRSPSLRPGRTSSATPKFRNVKTNGYASKREADRAAELKLLEQAGEILGLREQVPFEVIPKQGGERPCKYIADFTYTTRRGEYVVEDTKGVRTADYVIKRKLMLHVHGIRIRET